MAKRAMNSLFGDEGADFLTGGAGKDLLFGGADGDLFSFLSTLESGVGAANRDVVEDFEQGTDIAFEPYGHRRAALCVQYSRHNHLRRRERGWQSRF